MTGVITRLIAVTLLATSAPAVAQSASLDDLVRVSSGRAGALYLRPHADFRAYSKVMLQPSEIAFDKDWARDFNRSTRSLRNRVSDQDARRAIEEWQPRVDRIFADAFTRNALAPVAEAGPDVLMIRPVIINVRVTAPERPASGRVRTFAREAGSATLVLEARDSLTRQLVGVAVENRVAGDISSAIPRTSVSNASDFERLARDWATSAARGLTRLQAAAPVDNAGRWAR